MFLPSLGGLLIFCFAFAACSECQAQNTYDQLLSTASQPLKFARRFLGNSLGLSAHKPLAFQGKKAKDSPRLIGLNANIKCMEITGLSYQLFYPPQRYCIENSEGLSVSDESQHSKGLLLNFNIDDTRIHFSIRRQHFLNYLGGSIVIFGALTYGILYSYRTALMQQRETDKLIDKIIRANPNPYIILDTQLRIVSVSDSLKQFILKGIDFTSFDEAKKTSLFSLNRIFSKESSCRIIDFLKNIDFDFLRDSVSMKGLRIKDNDNLVFAASISVVRYANSVHYFLSLIDETKLYFQNNFLREQLSRDSLTGAYSRRQLFEVHHDLVRKDDYFLFLLDVDEFKEVIDSYGHDAGDDLLKQVVLHLFNFFGSSVEVFRLGGDEFIILSDFREASSIDSVSASLNDSLPINFVYHGTQIAINFSFGSTVLSRSDNLPLALKHADNALIQAKKTGKHGYCVSARDQVIENSARSRLSDQLSSTELQDAYESGAVRLFLQPVFHLGLNQIVGYESLIRIVGADGLIPPSGFLESFYRLSALSTSPIDHYSCLEDLFLNINSGLEGWISYNINEIDLSDSCFDRLLATLSHCSSHYSRDIVLEISETTFLTTQYSSVIMDRISLLKSRGFQIALDDFGILSSNIYALSNLSVDIVKLDKFIVTGIESNFKNQHIIESFKSLSLSLGFELLAEGIESVGQAECLKSLGVQLHQGFLYGNPVPVSSLVPPRRL